MSMLMDFGRVCGFGRLENIRGDPWYGTLARYVRRPHPAQSTTPASPLSMLFPLFHLPHMQKRAGGGSLWRFGSVPTSSVSPAGRHRTPMSSFLTGERSRPLHLPQKEQVTFRHRPCLHLPCMPDDEGIIIYQDIEVHARMPRLLFIPNF